MTTHSPVKSILVIQHWHLLAVVLLLMIWVPSASTQDEKGCQGVGYTKHPRSEYAPENLKRLLARDPKDVDALVDMGLHLEEQDQFTQAYGLYERAIEARPSCYLGYYFAGLVGDRISRNAASDAEANIRKALSLNPSLQDDGNVQGFMKRHPQPVGAAAIEREPPSETSEILATANRFSVGLGVGVLLATLVFYLARSRQTAPRGT